MATYKNIRIKKRGGGTRLQRVKVLASGKYKFVKNTGSTKSSKRKTSRKNVAKKNSRKRSKKRIPVSGASGVIVSIFGSPNPGWATVYQAVKAKNMPGAMQSFLASWTGIRVGPLGGQATTEFDVFGVLNPFDMRNAPALKTVLWTKLATKVVRRIIGNPLRGIPFIGDYISWS